MNENEQIVEETTIPTETTEETTVVEETTADPIDVIEDIDELRKTAKAYRSTANRYKKSNSHKTKTQIINREEPKPYNILEDEVADLVLSGYKKDEIKFIMANGGPKVLEDKNSYVTIAINSKREQRRVEETASETSSKGYVSNGGKMYTEEQLRNMTPEEMEKVLPHA